MVVMWIVAPLNKCVGVSDKLGFVWKESNIHKKNKLTKLSICSFLFCKMSTICFTKQAVDHVIRVKIYASTDSRFGWSFVENYIYI